MLPRVLVLLLLVMNIGVAVWWTLRPAPPAPAQAATAEPGVAGLRLLSELDPGASAEDSDAVAMTALALGPPAPSSECLQIGPFLTQIDLRRAMNAIAPAAQRIQFRETREVIRRGYRVFLPSPGSREAALEQARQLSRKGVSDYYVVTAGDEQNTISLGMYREQDNAETRLAQVRALGFEARVEPRNEELPQFWIDAELPLGSDWRARLGGYAGVGGQPIPCAPLPAPAADAGESETEG